MLHTTFDRENAKAVISFKDAADPDEILDLLDNNPFISSWTIKNYNNSKAVPETFLHFEMEESTWEAYTAIKHIGIQHLSNGPIVGYHTMIGLVATVCDQFAFHRLAVLADLCHQRDFDE